MITWFDEPYKGRTMDGFEVLLHGVFLDPVFGLAFVTVDGDGAYGSITIAKVKSGFRYDRKNRHWIGDDDPQTED